MEEERNTVLDEIDALCDECDFTDEQLERIRKIRDNIRTEPEQNFNESDIYDENGTMWKERFKDMKRKYHDRFFTSEEEIKADQFEDVEKDDKSEKIKYEDLFINKESDYK